MSVTKTATDAFGDQHTTFSIPLSFIRDTGDNKLDRPKATVPRPMRSRA